MLKRKVILFANTLWFLNRFKYSLIEDLIKRDYEVFVVYFRKGPIKDLEKLNLNKYSIKILNFISFLFQEYLNKRTRNKTKKILLSYTVGPILISSLPLFSDYKRFATLEGLGRIFSSKNFIFLLIRFFIRKFYRFIFYRNYDALFVLNHLDFAYLLESNLVPISKLFILPGTGVDSSIYNPDNLFLERRNIGYIDSYGKFDSDSAYISYIGRISSEKGFFRFLAAILYLINDNSIKYKKFRIIAPKQDIMSMSSSLKSYLLNIGIEIKEYIDEPLTYYASSKLIVLPTTYGEGLSRVALEAAFLGVPVAAIHNRGISSLFMDGMLGEATMEQEPYGISRIIKKICENYILYERQNNNVYKNLVDKYDNKSSTNKLISILEGLI
ncbi:glycosyltransferase [Prochlorococcus marinus]|uniref:glycosyltransferase n=1 Tax=Prochlorococcus marinus TaxID=1219 RepID=UPI000190058D|nr:glycosyltransferase [Prochlorococcus marinus]EEE39575.1 glycosyl transferase group 1 [Prochlorococcus marinus str. MIT 9202]